ncbi:MAG: M48 family metallopeptidase [Kangiella sp.]|nr:M48 family metallopeptidase [Kangiella sp.]
MTKKLLSFYYGDEAIVFERKDKQQFSPKVSIKVHSDCTVQVYAPKDVSDKDVVEAAKKRGQWINRKLTEFKKLNEEHSPREYISGESHFYLGRRYMLKVHADKKQTPTVRLFRGTLEVYCKEKSTDTVKALLDEWYKDKAKQVFKERLEKVVQKTPWVTEPPLFTVRTMKKQWGSCSPKGRLLLNTHLVKASKECIDYVILHELCHLVEHNHSKRFYKLMGQVMPDWEKAKLILDVNVNHYFGM